MQGAIFCNMSIIEFYDHIAPLSHIIDVPIFVCDDPIAMSLCNKYYPEVDIRELTFEECSPYNFVAHNDFMIFPSHVIREEEFLFAEAKKQGKKLCMIFCPHGFSDKTYYWQEYSEKDFIFVYGQNMFDIFEEIGKPLDKERCIIVGNYRYEYYKKHKAHHINLLKEECLQGLDMNRNNLLYAPTWVDEGDGSTFFEGIQSLVENLPDNTNLIIKPHPRILVCHPDKYYKVLSQYAQVDNVVFIEEFPLIYPILDLCDYYLGDMSSIGYDFLSFNKPMFFINKQRESRLIERERYLYRCGTSIEISDLPQLYEIIAKEVPLDKEKYSSVRQEVYDYTFGTPIPESQIKEDFLNKTSHFINRN